MTDAVPGHSADDVTPTAVMLSFDTLKSFIGVARDEYDTCTPAEPPCCFAVLIGRVQNRCAKVTGMEFASNVRAVDPAAVEEFNTAVAPCFGAAYRNTRRGFWCSPKDLLRIYRQAEREDVDVLGSIHLHPDWHRIGPPAERGLTISERPTPMDRYMFHNTRYPLNMICYLESAADDVAATLAAWGPPPEDEPDGPCPELTVRFSSS
ncbi:hypothetical protein [Streptomyces sp. NPDC059176]|uniref:hypothetical protein n=1 Tax=unclassified Streptomyces TaxID=2593676 RepID=UPI003687DEC9